MKLDLYRVLEASHCVYSFMNDLDNKQHYQSRLEEIQQLHRELALYVDILGPSFVELGVYPEAGYKVTAEAQQHLSDNIARCKTEQVCP